MTAAALMFASLAMNPQVYDKAPLPDTTLADLRGGVLLPNGIEAALTIETQTAVNGAVVLMTVLKIDTGAPHLSIFAPAEGSSVSAQQGASSGSGSKDPPQISFNTRDGLQVIPGSGRPPFAVTSGNPTASPGVQDGMVPVDSGSPLQTNGGQISVSGNGKSQAVEFTMPGLQVLHLAGPAFGSVLANSGSDRAIDTQTVVSLDLSNAGPDVLGSAMLRATDVGTEAMSMRF